MELGQYQDYFVMSGMVVLTFVAALSAHRAFFFILGKIFKHDSFFKKMVKAIRKPVFLLLMGFALIISFKITPFYEFVEEPLAQIILIFMMGTIGWLLGSMARAAHNHVIHKFQKEGATDISKRSLLTQVHFLYRAVMFLIITLSFSGILMTFPSIRSIGIGILSSAGIAGIALGIAARPILLNLLAGLQVAITRVIKLGDTVIVEGEWGTIEHIRITHVVLKIWDLRRLIVPISHFIDKPFENWSVSSTDLIGKVYFYVDYSVPLDKLRAKFKEMLEASPLWDGQTWGLVVTECTEKCMQIRATMSGRNSGDAWSLRCKVREELLTFIQEKYPEGLPKLRLQDGTARKT